MEARYKIPEVTNHAETEQKPEVKPVVALLIWGYTVIATIIETLVASFLLNRSATVGYSLILLLGCSQLMAIGAYFMHLKDENRLVYRVFLASFIFAIALASGVLVSVVGFK